MPHIEMPGQARHEETSSGTTLPLLWCPLFLLAGLTRDLWPPERQGSGGRTSHEYLYLLALRAGCDLALRTFAEV